MSHFRAGDSPYGLTASVWTILLRVGSLPAGNMAGSGEGVHVEIPDQD